MPELTRPTLAQLADALIAVFEGPMRLTAFQDAGGVWTIGRGHTKNVIPGQTISHDQAVEFFTEDEAPLLAQVDRKNPIAGAAYVSFGYNCGAGALHSVLAGTGSMADPKHTTDRKGNVETGLVSRRRLEQLLIASVE